MEMDIDMLDYELNQVLILFLTRKNDRVLQELCHSGTNIYKKIDYQTRHLLIFITCQ